MTALLACKGHHRSGLNVPSERAAGQTVCDLCEFYAAGAALPLSMTLTNSPSVLTYKSLSRKLPGHHVSDVPEVISLSLIEELKKIKKRTAIRGQAITTTAHKTYPLFWFNPIRHPLKLQLFSGKPD